MTASFDLREDCSRTLKKLMSMVPTMDDAVLADVLDSLQCILARALQSENNVPGKQQNEVPKRRNEASGTDPTAEAIKVLSIKDLPEEMLLKIMSYLNLPDRKNSRLVSKQWHRLSYDNTLIKCDWTKIMLSDHLNLTTPTSRHLNVMVHKNENLMGTLPFWTKHGEHVEVIGFEDINYDDRALPPILECCPNVKHIFMTLTGRQEVYNGLLPAVALSHLERLEVMVGVPRLCCDMIDALFPQTPKLKELACLMGYLDSEDHPEFWNLVKRQSAILEELYLRPLSCRNAILIVDAAGAQVRRLHLHLYPKPNDDFNDDLIYAIARKFVNLEHLSLCHSRFSPAIDNIVSSLKNLTHLSLCKFDLSTAPLSLFIAINELTQLMAIDLRGTRITAENLMIAFYSTHPNLINLKFSGIAGRSDIINQICPNLPNLISLEISDYHLGEDDVKLIARYNTQLKDLSFSQSRNWHCNSINEIETLVHLRVEYEKCSCTVRALSLPKLHTIDLRSMDITTRDIMILLEKNLSLHRIEGLNEENVMTDDIRHILERRTPNRPCRRQEDIFPLPIVS